MGCEVSKYINSKVELPKNQTVFDQNYNQRKPLQLKDHFFISELN